MRSFGFTLIDLVVTLSVLGILLAIGLPSFSAQIQKNRVKTATLKLQDSIALTRTTAVFSNSRATMTQQNDWETGWEIFKDTNNNGKRDGDEITLQQHEKLIGIRVVTNRPIKNYVSYIGSGESRNASGTNSGGFQAGTFTICPTEKGAGFELILSRGGRVRMNEIGAEKCEAAQTS